MINIADEHKFRKYLKEKNLISDLSTVSIRRLGGGVSCETIIVESATRSFVIKQALPKLKVQEDWFSDVTRIKTEKNCLDFYNQIVPESTPRLLFFDEQNYLYGMEAAPEGSIMWKDYLLTGIIDFGIARQIALTLARVHNASATDHQIRITFESQTFFQELRLDPYLKTVAERHPTLANLIEQEIQRLLANKLVLVHGDYSPKNILVHGSKIYVLDFEVAHLGDPSFDLAFLTNHFLLKAIKNKHWAASYLNLAIYTIDTYLAEIKFKSRESLEPNTLKTLALLFLARVDGKSPAEYITEDKDKELIRTISYGILQHNIQTVRELAKYCLNEIDTITAGKK